MWFAANNVSMKFVPGEAYLSEPILFLKCVAKCSFLGTKAVLTLCGQKSSVCKAQGVWKHINVRQPTSRLYGFINILFLLFELL